MRARTERSYHEGILRVLVYIQKHLDEELSLTELAGIARFSTYHFHRLFRSLVGEPLKGHIRRLRLERAANRLKLTRQSITTIALEAGFETPESFSRAFQAMFGNTPSRFRRDTSPLSFNPDFSGTIYIPDGHRPVTGDVAQSSDLKVHLEKVSPLKVAFVRGVGPYGTGWAAWQKLLAWARPRGLLKRGTLLIGIRQDFTDVTPPKKNRYDACITVDDTFIPEGEIGVQEVGGGEYAVVTHRGAYGKRFAAYAYLCEEWLHRNRRVLRAAPVFELYRHDWRGGRSLGPLTRIHVPVEPAWRGK